MCNTCGKATPVDNCDGWLFIGRVSINPTGPLHFLGAFKLGPDGMEPVPEPEPELTDDPLAGGLQVELCSTACAITYLESRQAWAEGQGPEQMTATGPQPWPWDDGSEPL